MFGLCIRHVPMELRTDIEEVNFWYVPITVVAEEINKKN